MENNDANVAESTAQSRYHELIRSDSKISVGGTDDNDLIISSGSDVTILPNGGNDTITGSDYFGELFLIGALDGNNTITNFSDNDSIKITNGSIASSLPVGNDLVITLESEGYTATITLKDAAKKSFKVSGHDITVANPVNIIRNVEHGIKVPGTDGADLIYNQGSNVIIDAGAGNDTIVGSAFGELFQFGAYDNQNLITNFESDDSLKVTYGEIASVNAVGSDVVVTIKGTLSTSTVTLKGAAGLEFDRSNPKFLTAVRGRTMLNLYDDQTVIGTGGSDLIINPGKENVTIQANGGNDTLEGGVYGELYLFSALDGNNVITNFTRTSDGSDSLTAISGEITSVEKIDNHHLVTISNGKSTCTVKLENTGDLVLKQTGNTLIVDNDANYIPNFTPAVVVSGTDENDYIENTGIGATIRAGQGKDTIVGSTFGEVFEFSAVDGRNLITNFGENDTLRITDNSVQQAVAVGNDYVIDLRRGTNSGSITLAGAANLNIVRGNEFFTVDSTKYLVVGSDNVTFRGTAGDDYITNTRQGVTINAGTGNDTVTGSTAYGEVFVFSPADGNNIITNLGKNDTIYNSSGTMSYETSGDDVIVSIRDGANSATVMLLDTADYNFNLDGKFLTAEYVETIPNSDPDQLVTGSARADVIINYGERATIQSGGGNDTVTGSDEYGELYLFASTEDDNVITNFGLNDTLRMTQGTLMSYAVDGDDVVVSLNGSGHVGTVRLLNTSSYKFSTNGNNLLVEGINTISNTTPRSVVSGSGGADYIINSAASVTVDAGGGNDTIEGSTFGEVFLFGALGGNDLITNFGVNDTLQLSSGTIQNTVKRDDDVIVTVANDNYSGVVTLRGTGNYEFAQNAARTRLTVKSITPIVSTADNQKLNGTAGDDLITNSHSGSTIQANAGNDTVDASALYGEMFLFSYLDEGNLITNFGKNDSLRMTAGSLMSGARVGDDYVVTIEGSGRAATITLKGAGESDFSIDGGLLTVVDIATLVNDTPNALFSGTGNSDYMINALEGATIQPGAGDDTVEGSELYGEMYLFASNTGNNVVTNFGKNDTLRCTAGSIATVMTVGDDAIVSLKGSKFSGTVTLKGAGDYNFNLKSSVLTVVPDDVTVSNNKNNTVVSGTEGNDLIINSGSNVTINPGGGDDTIEGSYFGEVFAISHADARNTIINFGANDTIRATSGSIKGFSTVGDDVIVTISSGNSSSTIVIKDAADLDFVQSGNLITVHSEAPIITNNDHGRKISGSANAEYIINTGSNVTIQGNGGADTIEGSDAYGEMILVASNHGDDVILNFGDNDSLKATAGNINSYSTVGDDVIVSIKGASFSSAITLKNAAGRELVKSGNVLTVHSVPTLTNNDDGVKFNGTSDDEYMINGGEHVTISAGAGNDTVEGSDEFGEMYLFASNTGDNVVTNFGVNDTLKCTAGKIASVTKVGADAVVSLKGSAYSGMVTLQGAGDYEFVWSNSVLTVRNIPTLDNSRDNVKFSGSSGDEYMINSGEGVTIQSNAGNDTIEGSEEYGEMYLFASNTGNNVVTNFGKNDTLKCTAGKIASVTKVGADAVVSLKGSAYSGMVTLLGAGDYEFVQNGSVLTVRNIPTLDNSRDNVKFSGSSGDEYMINSGEGVTIQSNAGNDTIEGSEEYGEMYLFASNTGNNVVTNFGVNDTLKCTAGKIASVTKVGNDAVVSLKGSAYSGMVTLLGAGDYDFVWSSSVLTVHNIPTLDNSRDNVKFSGSSGDEYMINSGEGVTIQSNAGNDTIEGSDFGEMYLFASNTGNNVVTNFGVNDTLKCTAGKIASVTKVGNDAVVSLKGSAYSGMVTLLGAGDYEFVWSNSVLTVDAITTLNNYMDNVKFTGSSGDDYMINSGEGVTIQSNAGNDTIEGSTFGEMYLFASNTGNNVVTNFGVNDTLKCTAGKIASVTKVGNDAVVSLKGSAYSGMVTLLGAGDYEFVWSNSVLTVDAITTLNNYMDNVKFTGSSGDDYMINSGEGVTIQSGAGNDTIEGAEEYGELYLFSSADGNNVITNFGKGDSLRMTAGTSLTFATVGSDVVVTLKGKSYTGVETLLGAAGLELVKSGSVITVEATPDEIVNFNDYSLVSGTSEAEYIYNYGEGVTIDGKGGGDTITGSDYFGEVFLVASTYGNGNVINNFSANDTLKCTAGNIQSLATVGNDVIVNLKGAVYSGDVTLIDAAGLNLVKSGSYITVAGGSDTIYNNADNVKLSGTDANDYIVNVGKGVTIEPGAGNDTIEGSDEYGEVFFVASSGGNDVITNFNENDTLRCTAGKIEAYETIGNDVLVSIKGSMYSSVITLKNRAVGYRFSINSTTLRAWHAFDPINNDEDNVKVSGTSGSDYIVNTGEGVTIQSGTGDDTIVGSEEYGEVFLFSSADGDNVITNFGANDTLKCTAGSINAYAIDGDDVIVTLKGSKYQGTVTLKNAADYYDAIKVSGNSLYIEGIDQIINRNDDVKIIGTSNAEYIVNFGESVTLDGRGGGDTITGSDEYGDVFLVSSAYGDGNVITNFNADDTLRSTAGKIVGVEVQGDDVLVSLQGATKSGTILLQGAAQYSFDHSSSILTVSGYSDVVNEIYNYADNTMISDTEGDDYIVNYGSGVTIQSGGGNDTLEGSDEYGDVFRIRGSNRNVFVTNFSANDTLFLTSIQSLGHDGDDYVLLTGDDSGVRLLNAGELTLLQDGNYITAASVAPLLDNYTDGVKLTGTSGADYIVNHGEDVTIEGGNGDDTITGSIYGDVILVASNRGDDVITNFGRDDTLRCTGGKIFAYDSVGNDIVVTLKGTTAQSTITLKDVAAKLEEVSVSGSNFVFDDVRDIINTRANVKVVGTKGRDFIINNSSGATIDGGTGDDSIYGSSIYREVIQIGADRGNDLIYGFDRDDTLQIVDGELVTMTNVGDNCIVEVADGTLKSAITLQGAADYDWSISGSNIMVDYINYMTNTRSNVKLSGTSRADSILSFGEGVTIESGAGNDTVTGSTAYGDVFLFSSSDGNNVVKNFGLNDTLRCTSGSISGLSTVGNDVVVTLKGAVYSGTVTLLNAAGYDFKQSGVYLTISNDAGELPSGEDDYWFLNEAVTSEIDEIVNEPAENLLGDLLDKNLMTIEDNFGDSARSVAMSTTARHRK